MKSTLFWVISARNRTSIHCWAVAHTRTSGTTLFYIFFNTHYTLNHYDCLILSFMIAFVRLFFFWFCLLCVLFDLICVLCEYHLIVNGCDICAFFIFTSIWFIWNIATNDESLQYFLLVFFVCCSLFVAVCSRSYLIHFCLLLCFWFILFARVCKNGLISTRKSQQAEV